MSKLKTPEQDQENQIQNQEAKALLDQIKAEQEELQLQREELQAEKEAFETDQANQAKKFEYAFKDLEKRMAKMEKANQDLEKPKDGIEYKPGAIVNTLFRMALDAKVAAKPFIKDNNRKAILDLIKPVMDAHQKFFNQTDADHPDFELVTEHFRELRKQFNL